ncbi:MAG: hypothetical protein ACFFCT_03595 [Candidatus Odinarchaeota archaeon]
MEHHDFRGVDVSVQLGPCDDSEMGLVVKAPSIPVGISQKSGKGSVSGASGIEISIKEAANAEIVRHWPSVSIQNPNRRKIVYQAAKDALKDAEDVKVASVGFFTLALEIARMPSWEVAEEIVKAVYDHVKTGTTLDRIILVASSPIQLSSFQFALNNIKIIRND